MTRKETETLHYEMPDSIPLFPVVGALLLPGGQLPLNVFEPRLFTHGG